MGSLQRSGRPPFVVPAILVWLLLAPFARLSAAQLLLPDLQDKLIDPLQPRAGVKATVLLFTSSDCPISNRYAPEVQRLSGKFAPAGVSFWLVYPNPSDTRDVIREHVKTFAYAMGALRDPQHALVKRVEVTVTPEAVVIDGRGRIVYRGRIDDRYVDISRQRPVATRHDLDEALTATIAGKPVAQPTTQAVGCYIADFRP